MPSGSLLRGRLSAFLVALSLVVGVGVHSAGAADSPGLTPSEILDRAFQHLYGYDLTTEITLELRNERGETSTRKLEVARKEIDGRLHSLGRFVEPRWIRGTSILMIENFERSDDHFVFLPEEERIRRVTSVQRSDSFLGTDLWFEDFERRQASDFEIVGVAHHAVGAGAIRIQAKPDRIDGYSRVEFKIEPRTHLLLETRFFRGETDRPFRVIRTDREAVRQEGPHLVPTHLVVRNLLRGTTTDVFFERVEVNPELADSLFRAATLQLRKKFLSD